MISGVHEHLFHDLHPPTSELGFKMRVILSVKLYKR
jgi:hypothetical protein